MATACWCALRHTCWYHNCIWVVPQLPSILLTLCMPVLQHATVDGPEMESARPCMMRPEQQHGHLVARAERAQGMKTMLQQVRHWQAELKLAEPRQALLPERQHLGHSLASSSQPICRGLRRSPQFGKCRQRLSHKQFLCLVVLRMS